LSVVALRGTAVVLTRELPGTRPTRCRRSQPA